MERHQRKTPAARGEEWDKAIYSRLDGAKSAAELADRAEEMRARISKVVWSIKRRKNW